MSDAAIATSPAQVQPAGPRPSRTFLGRIVGETLTHWGARLGLAWIVLLTALAVFAPFIANSRPVLIQLDGRWSSPMLSGLTAADVALVIVFVIGVAVICMRRLPPTLRLCIVIGSGMVAFGGALAVGDDSGPEVFEAYRRAEREGRVQYVLRAPIPYSPRDRLRDFKSVGLVPPWWASAANADLAAIQLERFHWLGNESNGSDLASRMIHACRVAMTIGFIATGLALLIGVVTGGVLGYYSGATDLIGMRAMEIIEFIPQLFLLLIFVAFYGRNIYFIMIIIGLTSWTGYARFIRAEFLKLRKQDFVQAAIACGLPLRSILFRHMLPNGVTPVLVAASFGVASAILAEATLSFLGLGLVDEPSWGELLNQAVKATGTFVWWIAIFPGGAIFLTVFAYNLIGEALRDAIDPHLKKTAHL